MAELKELHIVGVRFEEPGNAPVLILREIDGARVIPIWIGGAEATAIAIYQQGIVPDRPQSHDLHLELLEKLGHSLTRVEIVKVERGTFYADLLVDDSIRISARPSDAVAIALRADAPVCAVTTVLDEVGISTDGDGDVDVEAFREFLDHVSAEDFKADEPGSDS